MNMTNETTLFCKDIQGAFERNESLYIERTITRDSFEESTVTLTSTDFSRDDIYLRTENSSFCWSICDIENLEREVDDDYVHYTFRLNCADYLIVMDRAA